MQKKAFFCSAIVVMLLVVSSTQATPVVIGGSSLESPPPFWDNSYWGMPASIERAFPFTVISRGPYYAEELQVAAFHGEFQEGSLAYFSINLDDAGRPGAPIATFEMTGIPTTPQVVSAEVIEETVLYSDTPYWLVGRTPQGQVNWNLADNVFGTVAYRVDQGDWVILSGRRNVSAFAILGSQVPESATLLLLGLGGLALRRKRRAK
jgi:hypothetical protein